MLSVKMGLGKTTVVLTVLNLLHVYQFSQAHGLLWLLLCKGSKKSYKLVIKLFVKQGHARPCEDTRPFNPVNV